MRGAADGLAAGCRQRTTGDSPTRPVEGLAPSAFSTQPDCASACMCRCTRVCSSPMLARGGCSTLGSGHESTQATHTVTGRGEPHLRTREYRQILLIAAAHTLHIAAETDTSHIIEKPSSAQRTPDTRSSAKSAPRYRSHAATASPRVRHPSSSEPSAPAALEVCSRRFCLLRQIRMVWRRPRGRTRAPADGRSPIMPAAVAASLSSGLAIARLDLRQHRHSCGRDAGSDGGGG